MATEVASDLRDRLERAFALDLPQVLRLGAANTSVNIRVEGDDDASVTLLLDRRPPEVASGDEPAEITLELPADAVDSFARGEYALPAALMAGEAGAAGPVRKYLALDPIVRDLLANHLD